MSNQLDKSARSILPIPDQLQRALLIEATKYNVIPLDDRRVERFIPALAGRPTVVKGKKQIYFPGMERISEATILDHKNKSFQLTAQIVVPHGGAPGTIVALGGGYGGRGLMMEKGAARFVYNLFGVKTFVTDATKPAPGRLHAHDHEQTVSLPGDGVCAAQTHKHHTSSVFGGLRAASQPHPPFSSGRSGQSSWAACAPPAGKCHWIGSFGELSRCRRAFDPRINVWHSLACCDIIAPASVHSLCVRAHGACVGNSCWLAEPAVDETQPSPHPGRYSAPPARARTARSRP